MILGLGLAFLSAFCALGFKQTFATQTLGNKDFTLQTKLEEKKISPNNNYNRLVTFEDQDPRSKIPNGLKEKLIPVMTAP